MGNGISPKHWWAKGAGADMELSKSLQPLAPLTAKLNVISGLFNKHATGVGIHPGPDRQHPLGRGAAEGGRAARAASAWTRCSPPASARRPPQPSLVLGCEQPITGYHETNFSMAYSSHISWQDANSPVPMEVYPVAGLRQPLRQPGQPADAEHPRPRQGAGRGPEPAGQPRRPGQARRVPDQRPRGGEAGRAHPRR